MYFHSHTALSLSADHRPWEVMFNGYTHTEGLRLPDYLVVFPLLNMCLYLLPFGGAYEVVKALFPLKFFLLIEPVGDVSHRNSKYSVVSAPYSLIEPCGSPHSHPRAPLSIAICLRIPGTPVF